MAPRRAVALRFIPRFLDFIPAQGEIGGRSIVELSSREQNRIRHTEMVRLILCFIDITILIHRPLELFQKT